LGKNRFTNRRIMSERTAERSDRPPISESRAEVLHNLVITLVAPLLLAGRLPDEGHNATIWADPMNKCAKDLASGDPPHRSAPTLAPPTTSQPP
jgi:hypothetical protein